MLSNRCFRAHDRSAVLVIIGYRPRDATFASVMRAVHREADGLIERGAVAEKGGGGKLRTSATGMP